MKEKAIVKMPPNTVCTGRWGFCRVFGYLSGFKFSLLPSRVHARPSASNANRYFFNSLDYRAIT